MYKCQYDTYDMYTFERMHGFAETNCQNITIETRFVLSTDLVRPPVSHVLQVLCLAFGDSFHSVCHNSGSCKMETTIRVCLWKSKVGMQVIRNLRRYWQQEAGCRKGKRHK